MPSFLVTRHTARVRCHGAGANTHFRGHSRIYAVRRSDLMASPEWPSALPQGCVPVL